jgi:hypothetical protein
MKPLNCVLAVERLSMAAALLASVLLIASSAMAGRAYAKERLARATYRENFSC